MEHIFGFRDEVSTKFCASLPPGSLATQDTEEVRHNVKKHSRPKKHENTVSSLVWDGTVMVFNHIWLLKTAIRWLTRHENKLDTQNNPPLTASYINWAIQQKTGFM